MTMDTAEPPPPSEGLSAKRPPGRHPHINRARVRKTALEICAHDIRHKKFRRFADSFFDYVEASTRAAIATRVKQQPSVGKTLT